MRLKLLLLLSTIFISAVLAQTLELTKEEKRYLLDKKEIKVCADPSWMPFEKIKDNRHIGLASDYMKLFSKEMKIPINLVVSKSWSKSIEKLKNRECDILSLAIRTPQREKYMNFTKPYISSQVVVATKVGIPFINKLSQITDKKLGIVKDYSLYKHLKKTHPNINLIEVKSIEDGLQKVEDGVIFGYLDSYIVINYQIDKSFARTISISGKFKEKYHLSIATRNDEPMLNDIFQKAILNMDDIAKHNIFHKWINTRYEVKTNKDYIWQTIIGIFVVIALVLYRQNVLKRLNDKLELTKKELEESLHDFEYLFNNTMEGISLFRDNLCVDINEEGLKLFRIKNKKDMIGKDVLNFIHPSSLEIVKHKLSKPQVEPYELNVYRGDNTSFPILVKGYNTTIRGKVTRITSFIDLSILKQKEYELEGQKQKAQASNKAKSQFLANMSHEIRTPMNGIIGMTHLALQSNLDKKQENYLKKIDTSSKSLLLIINDILDFSKIEAGKLSINKVGFKLKDLLQEISDSIKIKADEKGLGLKVNYDTKTLYFNGDALRIKQILINLIGNSIKFTQYGTIDINIIKKDMDRYRFEIKDTGIGITQEEQKKLFQSFSQADGETTRKYGGTGLGLSISKQLVELMNGKIWCESKIGIGSTFIFEIDLTELSDDMEIEEKSISTLDDIELLSNNKILLTDDNEINQEIVVDLLEHSDMDIDIASDGLEAVNMVKSNQYDLIFMDLQMPVMDGIEATKIIRQIDKDIPIVALTANAMPRDIEHTKKAGMDAHLSKPIDVSSLYNILFKYLKKDLVQKSVGRLQTTTLPDFINIDKQSALKLINNNEKLYIKILTKFLKYKDIKLNELDANEFKITTHTLKGLSLNIGAIKLNKIIVELETTKNRDLVQDALDELKRVCDEIEQKILTTADKDIVGHKEILSDEKKELLFKNLRDAIATMKPKVYKPIVAEIQAYDLGDKDNKMFENIKTTLSEFNYKEAEEFFKEGER